MTRRVALIAGSGALVLSVISAIEERGDTLSVISITPRDDLAPTTLRLAGLDVAGLLAALQDFKPTHLALAGGIHISDGQRQTLASAAGSENAAPVGDMALGHLVARFEALTGARLIDLTELVPELMAPAGQIAGPAPSAAQQPVADFAFTSAREAGRLDLCQAVVASGGRLVAVEDIGGTDLLIERVLAFRERGLVGQGTAPMVLAKVSKPGQPAYFDLPAIGPTTIAKAALAGISLVVVEAGRTILLERPSLEREASRLGITVIGRPAND